jgi:hypothetical protein
MKYQKEERRMIDIKLPETLEQEDHEVIGEAIYFPNMEHNFYHMSPGVSSSTIRRFGQSQLHALNEEIEDSHALRFGTAAHSLIVEGEQSFNENVACLTGSPYTNANKSLKKDYESRGLTVISTPDRDKIYAMERALLLEGKKLLNPKDNEYPNKFVSPYEVAIFWEEDGVLLKVKSDVVRHPIDSPYSPNTISIIDYKTTQSCSVEAFTSSIKKYKYDLQASWYKRGYEKAGFKVENFIFVAQEKKEPYASKIFTMKADDLASGWDLLNELVSEYKAVINGKQASVYNSPDIIEVNLNDDKR